jgi:cystathionine gamma-synthase
MRLETLAIHAAHAPDPGSGALAPPIVLSTTFERDPDGGYSRGHYYARNGNPGREGLEGALAALESGSGAVALASGSAASAAVFSLLAPGDHVLVGSDCYYGTIKQLEGPFARSGVTHERVNMSRAGSVAERVNPRTRLLWVESPSNPLLAISDLAALARLAHQHGAWLACDNTFATPVLQRPFALGADLVIHSTTKYIGGHSDVMGGVVVTRDSGETLARLRAHQGVLGAVPSGFDCWLLRRSLATLPLRIRQQSENALAVARAVAGHRNVTAVHYPGLESHPGHAVAKSQMSAFGAMLSLQVAGGEKAAFAVAAGTRLFTRATSLGGVESLIEHRASVEGPNSRTPPDLLRLSIGLEHAQDLIDDLSQALDAINP